MIKIYALFILSVLATVSVKAQFDVGQKVLGGNIGFSTNKNENLYNTTSSSNSSVFSISPSLSWFNKPNHLIGIGLTYNYNNQKTKDIITYANSKNSSIGMVLSSQRFFTLSQNFFFTVNTSVGANYSFGNSLNTVNNITNETKNNGYAVNASFAPGLSYRVTKRLLFDAYLSNLIFAGYSHSETKNKDPQATNAKSTQSNFAISSSLSNTSLGNVGLGFRWLLRK